MAHPKDLSEYTDYPGSDRHVTKAVGWPGRGHGFEIELPSEELLDLLWQYPKVRDRANEQGPQMRVLPFRDACGA